MPPKNPREKRKKNSTDTDTSHDSSVVVSSHTVRNRSSSTKRSKLSPSKDRAQTKLQFVTAVKYATIETTMSETIMAQLENVQKGMDDLRQQIHTRQSKLSSQLNDQIERLTGTIFTLQKENDALKGLLDKTIRQCRDREDDVRNLRTTVLSQRETCNELEQYSRRESLRVFGLKGDGRNETTMDCENKVLSVLRTKLGLSAIDGSNISALHRTGRPSKDTNRPVIVKFVSRKDKEEIMKNRRKLKGTGIVITDDLTVLNYQRLTRIRQDEKVVDAWSINGGRLFAKLLDNSIVEIVRGDTNVINDRMVGYTPTKQQRQQQQQKQQRVEQQQQRRQQRQSQQQQWQRQHGQQRQQYRGGRSPQQEGRGADRHADLATPVSHSTPAASRAWSRSSPREAPMDADGLSGAAVAATTFIVDPSSPPPSSGHQEGDIHQRLQQLADDEGERDAAGDISTHL